MRTSFSTIKGSLLRYILYPKPTKFKFYTDAYKFIAMLALLAFVGFLVSLPTFIQDQLTVGRIFLKSLDLFTITIPPQLLMSITIGTGFALVRIKKKKIFCISPPRINVSGKVNIVCFDKTGTLTEDGLHLQGCKLTKKDKKSGKDKAGFKFGGIKKDLNKIQDHSVENHMKGVSAQRSKNLFIEAMASCHSLASVNGELIGDPLDFEMFKGIKWQFQEKESQNDLVVIENANAFLDFSIS